MFRAGITYNLFESLDWTGSCREIFFRTQLLVLRMHGVVFHTLCEPVAYMYEHNRQVYLERKNEGHICLE